jgi:hypothetical protein
MTRNLLLTLGAVAFALLLGEGILRSLGRTAAPLEPPLRVIASNGRFHAPDDELGYTNAPNMETRIELLKARPMVEFTARTDDRGRRWTGPRADGGTVRRPEIWIFGCSFTFGWGVDDDESFPWLLQQRFPSFAVRNYGVSGYGTLQSLLQYQRALRESEAPRIAILAYATFHDERNVVSTNFSKGLGQSWRAFGEARHPYMRWLGDGKFAIGMSSAYQPYVPFIEYSALANRLDRAIVKLLERRALPKDHRQDVSRHLVDEFEKESRSHGVRFALGQLDLPLWMVAYARSRGIPAADMSVPKDPAYVIEGDGHPTARGHQLIADRAEALIESLLRPDSASRAAPASPPRAVSAARPDLKSGESRTRARRQTTSAPGSRRPRDAARPG